MRPGGYPGHGSPGEGSEEVESSVWDGREGFPVEVSGQGFDGYVRLGLKLQKGQEGGSRGREEGIVYKDLEAGLGGL